MNAPHRHDPGLQQPYPALPGRRLRYLLYLPPGFNDPPDRPWPVLCFLHGRGEAARNVEGVAQPIELLFSHGAPPWHCALNSPLAREFIVVSPQLPEQRPWQPDDLQELREILETIYADLRGDRDRTYLSGFSLGGRGVFDFAAWSTTLPTTSAAEPLRWAALWPVDDAATSPRTSCEVQRIWLHFGTWRPEVNGISARNLDLCAANPTRDPHPQGDRLYTDYSSPGYDHCQTCRAAYADAEVYPWLLRSGRRRMA